MPIVASTPGSLVDSSQRTVGALFILNIFLWCVAAVTITETRVAGKGAFLSDPQLAALELIAWIAVALTAGSMFLRSRNCIESLRCTERTTFMIAPTPFRPPCEKTPAMASRIWTGESDVDWIL
ncbi:hypothetical protein C8R44DRAFT_772114 [Mycena epipterygia]|nr:hypothetical protein C8R44DRAFT_772114 [Mycena epipterygia]